jgi:hypothetical protein
MWRGYVRSLGTVPVAWWALLVAVAIGRFSENRSPGQWAAVALIAVAAVLLFGVIPSLVLFARPQRLVPRPVRGGPGAWREWRDARRTPGARRTR